MQALYSGEESGSRRAYHAVVVWLALFLDLASPLQLRRADEIAVYRQALADHAPRAAGAVGAWFQRCSVFHFQGGDFHYSAAAPTTDEYIAANVIPLLPPLPGEPGGPPVKLSAIIWDGDHASLEITVAQKSYCSTYRRDGSTFKLERTREGW
jgi:hypothetical protein